MKPAGPVFGFEEFWPKVYAEYKRQLDAIAGLIRLGDEVLKAALLLFNRQSPIGNRQFPVLSCLPLGPEKKVSHPSHSSPPSHLAVPR
jgi:hypothetical protein